MLTFVLVIEFVPREGEKTLNYIFSSLNGEKLWGDCDISRK
jgi:hypothetical protein